MKLPIYILAEMEWYKGKDNTDLKKHIWGDLLYSKGLYEMLRDYHKKITMPHDDHYEAAQWLFLNYDEFIEAYIQPISSHRADEQRYYIKLVDGMNGYANYDFEHDVFFIDGKSLGGSRKVQTQFTMSEVEELKDKFFKGLREDNYELEKVNEYEVQLRYIPQNTKKENG